MPKKTKEIAYHYRGGTERGTGKGSYVWHDGYSEGEGNTVSYPWLTYCEAQQEAATKGCKAVFYRDGKPTA